MSKNKQLINPIHCIFLNAPPPLPYLFFPVTFLTFSFKSLPQCSKIARSQLMPARN